MNPVRMTIKADAITVTEINKAKSLGKVFHPSALQWDREKSIWITKSKLNENYDKLYI